jgi:hypothetical protein
MHLEAQVQQRKIQVGEADGPIESVDTGVDLERSVHIDGKVAAVPRVHRGLVVGPAWSGGAALVSRSEGLVEAIGIAGWFQRTEDPRQEHLKSEAEGLRADVLAGTVIAEAVAKRQMRRILSFISPVVPFFSTAFWELLATVCCLARKSSLKSRIFFILFHVDEIFVSSNIS